MPDVVANPKAPHAAALMRRIAEVYRITKHVPSVDPRQEPWKARRRTAGPSAGPAETADAVAMK